MSDVTVLLLNPVLSADDRKVLRASSTGHKSVSSDPTTNTESYRGATDTNISGH